VNSSQAVALDYEAFGHDDKHCDADERRPDVGCASARDNDIITMPTSARAAGKITRTATTRFHHSLLSAVVAPGRACP